MPAIHTTTTTTEPSTRADQKKYGFWTKVAYVFNQNAPNGATMKASKTLNSHWNRAAPLVLKWYGCVTKPYQEKSNGSNEQLIIQNAYDFYEIKMGKKSNLMHWRYLLKDQPK